MSYQPVDPNQNQQNFQGQQPGYAYGYAAPVQPIAVVPIATYAPPYSPTQGYNQPTEQYRDTAAFEQSPKDMPQSLIDESSSSGDGDAKKLSEKEAKADAVTTALFVRKVYSLLSIQLLLTVIITAIFCLIPVNNYHSIGAYLSYGIWFPVVAISVGFILIIVSLFVSQKVPANYIMLVCYTICLAMFIGCMGGLIGDNSIVLAVFVIVLGTFASLTGLCFCTKLGHRVLYMAFAAIGLIILLTVVCNFIWVFAIMSDAYNMVFWLDMVYAGLFCAVFAVYIIIDTYIVTVAKHFNGYIYACTRIYVDIFYLLIMLLAMMGGSR